MGAVVTIRRLDMTASELRAAAKRAKDGSAARRMLALAMVFDGADRKTAAETCGMDRRTLRDWVHRYPAEYFDDIQDVKVTKDMLDLARHIVNQKAGSFEPEKFEDQYETALVDLINQKRAGKPIVAKDRPKGENVVDLMEALRRSVSGEKPTEAAAGQKEMLMPIGGKKPAKEAAANKPAAGARRKSA